MRATRTALTFVTLTFWVTSLNAVMLGHGLQEHIVRNDNNCESNKAYFDSLAVEAGKEGTIIVIARLGDGEKSRSYNRRRLHNISTYLTHIRQVPKERVVLAEGGRARGRGRVEVYVGGKLLVVFAVGRNQDLAGGECEAGSSNLYYPRRSKS